MRLGETNGVKRGEQGNSKGKVESYAGDQVLATI